MRERMKRELLLSSSATFVFSMCDAQGSSTNIIRYIEWLLKLICGDKGITMSLRAAFWRFNFDLVSFGFRA